MANKKHKMPKDKKPSNSFLKNAARSFGYSMKGAFKESMPEEVSDFIKANKFDFSKTKAGKIDIKATAKEFAKNNTSAETKAVKDILSTGKVGLKNALKDLKTGNIFGSEESAKIAEEFLNQAGGGGMDMEESLAFFDDLDFDDESGTESYSTEAGGIDLNYETNNQNFFNDNRANLNNITQINNVRNGLDNGMVASIANQLMGGISTISSQLNAVGSFQLDVTQEFYNQTTSFYNEVLEMLKKNTETLEKREEEQYKLNRQLNSLFDPETGAFSLKNFAKMGIGAAKSKTNVDMLLDDTTLNAIKFYMANPMKTLTDSFVKSIVPDLSSLSDMLTNLPNIMLSQMGAGKAGKSNNWLWNKLGKAFKINMDLGWEKESKVKEPKNRSGYTRGAISYNGEANKAITEVIPTYLSKILVELTGVRKGIGASADYTKELLMDYETGKMSTRKKVAQDKKDREQKKREKTFENTIGLLENQMMDSDVLRKRLSEEDKKALTSKSSAIKRQQKKLNALQAEYDKTGGKGPEAQQRRQLLNQRRNELEQQIKDLEEWKKEKAKASIESYKKVVLLMAEKGYHFNGYFSAEAIVDLQMAGFSTDEIYEMQTELTKDKAFMKELEREYSNERVHAARDASRGDSEYNPNTSSMLDVYEEDFYDESDKNISERLSKQKKYNRQMEDAKRKNLRLSLSQDENVKKMAKQQKTFRTKNAKLNTEFDSMSDAWFFGGVAGVLQQATDTISAIANNAFDQTNIKAKGGVKNSVLYTTGKTFDNYKLMEAANKSKRKQDKKERQRNQKIYGRHKDLTAKQYEYIRQTIIECDAIREDMNTNNKEGQGYKFFHAIWKCDESLEQLNRTKDEIFNREHTDEEIAEVDENIKNVLEEKNKIQESYNEYIKKQEKEIDKKERLGGGKVRQQRNLYHKGERIVRGTMMDEKHHKEYDTYNSEEDKEAIKVLMDLYGYDHETAVKEVLTNKERKRNNNSKLEDIKNKAAKDGINLSEESSNSTGITSGIATVSSGRKKKANSNDAFNSIISIEKILYEQFGSDAGKQRAKDLTQYFDTTLRGYSASVEDPKGYQLDEILIKEVSKIKSFITGEEPETVDAKSYVEEGRKNHKKLNKPRTKKIRVPKPKTKAKGIINKLRDKKLEFGQKMNQRFDRDSAIKKILMGGKDTTINGLSSNANISDIFNDAKDAFFLDPSGTLKAMGGTAKGMAKSTLVNKLGGNTLRKLQYKEEGMAQGLEGKELLDYIKQRQEEETNKDGVIDKLKRKGSSLWEKTKTNAKALGTGVKEHFKSGKERVKDSIVRTLGLSGKEAEHPFKILAKTMGGNLTRGIRQSFEAAGIIQHKGERKSLQDTFKDWMTENKVSETITDAFKVWKAELKYQAKQAMKRFANFAKKALGKLSKTLYKGAKGMLDRVGKIYLKRVTKNALNGKTGILDKVAQAPTNIVKKIKTKTDAMKEEQRMRYALKDKDGNVMKDENGEVMIDAEKAKLDGMDHLLKPGEDKAQESFGEVKINNHLDKIEDTIVNDISNSLRAMVAIMKGEDDSVFVASLDGKSDKIKDVKANGDLKKQGKSAKNDAKEKAKQEADDAINWYSKSAVTRGAITAKNFASKTIGKAVSPVLDPIKNTLNAYYDKKEAKFAAEAAMMADAANLEKGSVKYTNFVYNWVEKAKAKTLRGKLNKAKNAVKNKIKSWITDKLKAKFGGENLTMTEIMERATAATVEKYGEDWADDEEAIEFHQNYVKMLKEKKTLGGRIKHVVKNAVKKRVNKVKKFIGNKIDDLSIKAFGKIADKFGGGKISDKEMKYIEAEANRYTIMKYGENWMDNDEAVEYNSRIKNALIGAQVAGKGIGNAILKVEDIKDKVKGVLGKAKDFIKGGFKPDKKEEELIEEANKLTVQKFGEDWTDNEDAIAFNIKTLRQLKRANFFSAVKNGTKNIVDGGKKLLDKGKNFLKKKTGVNNKEDAQQKLDDLKAKAQQDSVNLQQKLSQFEFTTKMKGIIDREKLETDGVTKREKAKEVFEQNFQKAREFAQGKREKLEFLGVTKREKAKALADKGITKIKTMWEGLKGQVGTIISVAGDGLKATASAMSGLGIPGKIAAAAAVATGLIGITALVKKATASAKSTDPTNPKVKAGGSDDSLSKANKKGKRAQKKADKKESTKTNKNLDFGETSGSGRKPQLGEQKGQKVWTGSRWTPKSMLKVGQKVGNMIWDGKRLLNTTAKEKDDKSRKWKQNALFGFTEEDKEDPLEIDSNTDDGTTDNGDGTTTDKDGIKKTKGILGAVNDSAKSMKKLVKNQVKTDKIKEYIDNHGNQLVEALEKATNALGQAISNISFSNSGTTDGTLGSSGGSSDGSTSGSSSGSSSSGSTYTGTISTASTKAIEKSVWDFFTGNGFSAEATAGIMGNMYQESGMNPNSIQGGGKGPAAGIFQWENYTNKSSRWANLNNYAKKKGTKWTDLETQLEFALSEIQSTDINNRLSSNHTVTDIDGQTYNIKKVNGLDGFKNISSVSDGVMSFEGAFERAGKPNFKRRIQAANTYYKRYKGRVGSSSKKTSKALSKKTDNGVSASQMKANGDSTNLKSKATASIKTSDLKASNNNIASKIFSYDSSKYSKTKKNKKFVKAKKAYLKELKAKGITQKEALKALNNTAKFNGSNVTFSSIDDYITYTTGEEPTTTSSTVSASKLDAALQSAINDTGITKITKKSQIKTITDAISNKTMRKILKSNLESYWKTVKKKAKNTNSYNKNVANYENRSDSDSLLNFSTQSNTLSALGITDSSSSSDKKLAKAIWKAKKKAGNSIGSDLISTRKQVKTILKNITNKKTKKKAKKLLNSTLGFNSDGTTSHKIKSSTDSSVDNFVSATKDVKAQIAAYKPGYSQSNYVNVKFGSGKTEKVRTDCSGMVSAAVHNFNSKFPLNQASSGLGSNNKYFKQLGFSWTPWSSGMSSKLQKGDILVKPGHHTEIYAGNGKMWNNGSDYSVNSAGATGTTHLSDSYGWSGFWRLGKGAKSTYTGTTYDGTTSGSVTTSGTATNTSSWTDIDLTYDGGTSSSSSSSSSSKKSSKKKSSSKKSSSASSSTGTSGSVSKSVSYKKELKEIIGLLTMISEDTEALRGNKTTSSSTKSTSSKKKSSSSKKNLSITTVDSNGKTKTKSSSGTLSSKAKAIASGI